MHFNPVSGFGRKDVVEHLLQTGANVHARDDGGLIPLHNACSFGHAEVVSLLLCQGADPNARDNWNYTPLHEAAIKGKIDVCIGKDPMLVISKHGNSLIYTEFRLQEGWADLSQIHLLTIGGVWTGTSW